MTTTFETSDSGGVADRRTSCEVCGEQSIGRLHMPSQELCLPLCEQHSAALQRRLQQWLTVMSAARAPAQGDSSRRLRDGEILELVRAWAQGSGYPVAGRGAISEQVMHAFRAAHRDGEGEGRDAATCPQQPTLVDLTAGRPPQPEPSSDGRPQDPLVREDNETASDAHPPAPSETHAS